MTRIIAGAFGGRRLETPKGDGTRPTSDRVRESLFASLTSTLGGFGELRVLDLYAGSGALALEALSRGAASAVLIESDAKAAAVISRNVRELGVEAKVQRTTVDRYLDGTSDGPFDLVFCDPPYAVTEEVLTGQLTRLVRLLGIGSLVVVERSSRTPDVVWPDGIEAVRDKAYGETTLWYGQAHG